MNDSTINNQSLFRWLFALTTAYLAVSPLNMPILNNVFRIPSLLIIVLLISQSYQRERYKCSFAIWSLLLIFGIHLLIDTDITFDMLLSLFSIWAFLMLVIVSDTLSINVSTRKFINTCSIISALVLVAYYFSPIAHLSKPHGEPMYGIYLTYGLDNSNYAGIITLLILCMLIITMEFGDKKRKVLCLLLELVLVYFIYLTNTRAALAAALFIPLVYVFFRKRSMPNIILFALCCIPALFVPFYMNLGESGNVEGQEIMGKSIMSGRDEVYQEYLSTLSDPFFILIGNLQENKFQNAHNGPLAILASSGIIGVLCYFYIYLSKLLRANLNAKSLHNKMAVFVILATLINTAGEAALLLGGFPSITYLFVFFVFAQTYDTYSRG